MKKETKPPGGPMNNKPYGVSPGEAARIRLFIRDQITERITTAEVQRIATEELTIAIEKRRSWLRDMVLDTLRLEIHQAMQQACYDGVPKLRHAIKRAGRLAQSAIIKSFKPKSSTKKVGRHPKRR